MNQECVKPDAGDSERECGCKIGNQRQATAQKVLERYAWPGGLRWLGHRPWDTTDPQDYRCFVDICYLGGGEMSCDSGRVKLDFHVKFADDGAVSEAYAHDMRGCVVGQRGDVLHRESNPEAPSVIEVIRFEMPTPRRITVKDIWSASRLRTKSSFEARFSLQ